MLRSIYLVATLVAALTSPAYGISCYTALTSSTGATTWATESTEACATDIESCTFNKAVTSSGTLYTMGCSLLPGTPVSPFTTGCKVETVSWIYYTTNPGTKTVAEVKAIVDPITAACPTSAAGRTIPSLIMVTMAFLVTKFNC